MEVENGQESRNSSRLSSLLASNDRDFLISSDDSQVKISELQGKVVGIYFSANWYPPCRKFNNLLIDVYNQLRSQGCNDFEIVLVSSDEDISAFDSYRASMPWLAIPYSDLATKKALNQTFDVEAMPCLVFLQPNEDEEDDNTMLHDGVELIYRYGIEAFPFTNERLEVLHKEQKDKEERQTLVNLLTNHDRNYLLSHDSLSPQVPVTSLEGKTIGLYFSAQWCLPCVKFIPKLISIYQRIKQNLPQEEDFEIVFVSSDCDEASFRSYFGAMPWLALPYRDQGIKDLAKHFDVREIPSLVILGPNGKTVTKQGRYLVNLYQENAYPFTEARLEFLEKQMDEEAKSLPKSAFHQRHQHELNLVSESTGGGPFICCHCDSRAPVGLTNVLSVGLRSTLNVLLGPFSGPINTCLISC